MALLYIEATLCPNLASRKFLAAAARWVLSFCWATHMAATRAHHTDLQLTSWGAQPPPVSRLPWQNILGPDQSLTSSVPSCSSGPLPSCSGAHSCPGFLPLGLEGAAGRQLCRVRRGAAPSCTSPTAVALMTAAQSKGWGLSQLPPTCRDQVSTPALFWSKNNSGEGGLLGPGPGLAHPFGDSLCPPATKPGPTRACRPMGRELGRGKAPG